MKQPILKFRQRISDTGDYHYWGNILGTWIKPNEMYGKISDSEQWSGLLDKEDKEIYLHDILEYWKGHFSIVAFEDGGFVTKDNIYEDVGCGSSMWLNRKHIVEDCRVIGSITDILYKIPKTPRPRTLSKSRKTKV